MSETIRVGVIGFGMAGRYFHTAVIAETPGLELACIVQRSGTSAAEAYPKVKIARSIEEMLADASIRLVVVATPSSEHYEHAAQCLRAGKNVVVDKPFVLKADEARKLIELAREHKVLLSVYQNRRWEGDHTTLKEVLAAGELGRVVVFESHIDRYRVLPRLGAWRENGGLGGGILFDLGSHLIDQACSFFGDPESIWADVRVERDDAVSDDAFDIQLKFAGGVTGWLHSSLTTKFASPRYVVHGTKGSYVQWGMDPQEGQLKEGRKFSDAGFGERPESEWAELHLEGEAVRKLKTAKGDYRGLYANVRDAILGTGNLEVTPEQAWRTTRLIELARQSSAEGRRILFA
jgi:scyllo-inositol 2-dehydrogenase (NADP+)